MKNPLENIKTKSEVWEELKKKVENFADGIGNGMEESMIEPVTAINALGFITVQSCEGHLDRGNPYPWITLDSSFFISKINSHKQFGKDFTEMKALEESDLVKSDDYKQRTEDFVLKYGNPLEHWEEERQKMTDLLNEYFKDKPDSERYVLAYGLLIPAWLPENYKQEEYIDSLSETERKQLLEKSQKIFFGFADFLKQKFFEEK